MLKSRIAALAGEVARIQGQISVEHRYERMRGSEQDGNRSPRRRIGRDGQRRSGNIRNCRSIRNLPKRRIPRRWPRSSAPAPMQAARRPILPSMDSRASPKKRHIRGVGLTSGSSSPFRPSCGRSAARFHDRPRSRALGHFADGPACARGIRSGVGFPDTSGKSARFPGAAGSLASTRAAAGARRSSACAACHPAWSYR